jgi:hypothetical protein
MRALLYEQDTSFPNYERIFIILPVVLLHSISASLHHDGLTRFCQFPMAFLLNIWGSKLLLLGRILLYGIQFSFESVQIGN